jgi:putative hydrolase
VSKIEVYINNVKYSLDADYHTHTVYSHGTGSIEDNVRAAQERGLRRIGITDHGPSHFAYGIKKDAPARMRAEIEALRPKYPDMEIFLGVEANIVSGKTGLDVKIEDFPLYDYVIAGYHYAAFGKNVVYNGLRSVANLMDVKSNMARNKLMAANTRLVVNALEKNSVKILTHPGDKAPVDLLEVAVVCAKTDTLIEINTHHMSLSASDVADMALAPAKFVISSDAHSPDMVGDFTAGLRLCIDAGLDLTRIVNLNTEKI